jgi:hypothetical protein
MRKIDGYVWTINSLLGNPPPIKYNSILYSGRNDFKIPNLISQILSINTQILILKRPTRLMVDKVVPVL